MNILPPSKLHELPETAAEFYLALRTNHDIEVDNYWDLYSQLYPGLEEDSFWTDLELVTNTPEIQESKGVISVRPWTGGFCEINTYNFNRLSTRAKCVYFYACEQLGYNYVTDFNLKIMVKTLGYPDLLDLIKEVNEVMKRVIVIDTNTQIFASSIPLMAKFRTGEGLDAFAETVENVLSWRAFSLWRSLARDNRWKFFLTSKINSINARNKKIGNTREIQLIKAYLDKLIGYEKGAKVKQNPSESSTKFFNPLKISTLTGHKDKVKENKEKPSKKEGDLFQESEQKIIPVEAKELTLGVAPAIEDFTDLLDREDIQKTLQEKNRTETVDEAIAYACAAWKKKPVFALRPKPSSDDVWERHREEKEYRRHQFRVVGWLNAVINNMDDKPGQGSIDLFMQRVEEGWVSRDGKKYKDEPDAARKYDRKVIEKLISENNYIDLDDLAEKIIKFGSQKKSVEGVLSLTDIISYVKNYTTESV